MLINYICCIFAIKKKMEKEIIGYEGFYSCDEFGNIYGLPINKTRINGRKYIAKKRKINPSVNSTGYYVVSLRKNGTQKTEKVHRLIAKTFLLNEFNKSDVNHIDGNKLNNNTLNLEWDTKSENHLHKYHELGFKYNHTQESKDKMRIARYKYLKTKKNG